jgi:hypothetical protein
LLKTAFDYKSSTISNVQSLAEMFPLAKVQLAKVQTNTTTYALRLSQTLSDKDNSTQNNTRNLATISLPTQPLVSASPVHDHR